MAQKLPTLFIDDLDGGEAGGTVRFGFDGSEYEIDLSAANTEALHKALSTYIEHGRKAGSASRRFSRTGGRRTPTDSIDTTVNRAWPREQGIAIKYRGRVPVAVVAQYRGAIGQ
jgi:Lsr2